MTTLVETIVDHFDAQGTLTTYKVVARERETFTVDCRGENIANLRNALIGPLVLFDAADLRITTLSSKPKPKYGPDRFLFGHDGVHVPEDRTFHYYFVSSMPMGLNVVNISDHYGEEFSKRRNHGRALSGFNLDSGLPLGEHESPFFIREIKASIFTDDEGRSDYIVLKAVLPRQDFPRSFDFTVEVGFNPLTSVKANAVRAKAASLGSMTPFAENIEPPPKAAAIQIANYGGTNIFQTGSHATLNIGTLDNVLASASVQREALGALYAPLVQVVEVKKEQQASSQISNALEEQKAIEAFRAAVRTPNIPKGWLEAAKTVLQLAPLLKPLIELLPHIG